MSKFAERELREIHHSMKRWKVMIVGIWGIAALYTMLAMMIWDIAAVLQPGNSIDSQGLPEAWDAVLLLSVILVVITSYALSNMLKNMIPTKRRIPRKSVWDSKPTGPPATTSGNVPIALPKQTSFSRSEASTEL